jgi:hypothetical protein
MTHMGKGWVGKIGSRIMGIFIVGGRRVRVGGGRRVRVGGSGRVRVGEVLRAKGTVLQLVITR